MNVMNILVGVLVALVVIQSILLLLLFRQVGALLLARVDVIAAEGPALGSLLSEPMATSVGFHRNRADSTRRTLLLLTRRGCGACETALRSLPGWLKDRDEKPALLAAGDGMLDLDGVSRMRLKSMGMIEHEALEALTVFGVRMTPFAFLLDGEGRVLAKGILSREEHLKQLESQAQEQEAALAS